jgi:hypothetical protein
MKEEFELVLPYVMVVTGERESEYRKDYALTGKEMNELHSRSHKRLEELFEGCPPYGTVERINREVEALWDNPYAYALMVVDDALKWLHKKGIPAKLFGAWEHAYYAYLMGMLEEAPEERSPEDFLDRPLGIALAPEHRQKCAEALLLAAWKHKFYVRMTEEGVFLLLPPEQDQNPEAPVIRVYAEGA